MKPAVSWKQAYNLRLTGYDFVIWLVDNIARDETDDFLVEAISQNSDLKLFPNPFSDIVNITYWIEQNGESVDLKIYDVTGRVVKSFLPPASDFSVPTSITWNGRDEKGKRMASGVYFVMLRAGESRATRRVTLLSRP